MFSFFHIQMQKFLTLKFVKSSFENNSTIMFPAWVEKRVVILCLTPRFYVTEFNKASKTNLDDAREEFEAMFNEMKATTDLHHWKHALA